MTTSATYSQTGDALGTCIRRHRIILIAMPFLCMVIAAVVMAIMPKHYEAFGLIEISSRTSDQPFATGVNVNAPTDSMVLSQVEILKSHAVLQRAADRLHMSLDQLAHAITVTPLGRSYIIRVLAQGHTPQHAQTMANTVMQAYHDHKADLRTARSKHDIRWLDDQLNALATQMRDAAQAVIDYRAKHDLPDPTVLDTQIADVSAQLAAAKTRAAARTLDQQKRHQDLSTQLQSPTLITLAQTEAALHQKLGELRQKYGAKHPDLQAVTAELAALHAKQQAEIEKLRQAAAQDRSTNDDTIANLTQALHDLQDHRNAADSHAVALQALDDNAKVTRTLYENLLQQAKQANLSRDLDPMDAQPIAWALAPTHTGGPSSILVIILSGFAGLCLAVFAIILNEQLALPLTTADKD